jgi:hypothetical protein
LRPVFDSDPVKRVILLHPELASLLDDPQGGNRVQRLRADLETFVKGEELALSAVPYEHKNAYLGLLAPESDGTWEIHSRDPAPGMRVLGRFAQKDCFVALGWRLRSRRDPRWPDQRALGGRNSLEYQLAQIEVEQRWSELFPEHKALAGSDISELLSDKYHCV